MNEKKVKEIERRIDNASYWKFVLEDEINQLEGKLSMLKRSLKDREDELKILEATINEK